MAFMVRSEGHKKSHLEAYAGYKAPKKDRPLCTHCNLHGHIVDKCFYGYPPGYRSKERNHIASANHAMSL